MKTDTSSDERCAPFVALLATPIPQHQTTGTQTATLVHKEAADEDQDYEVGGGDASGFLWEQQGATYDASQGLWIKNAQPFVILQGIALGTETLTKIVEEEADEDR
jgi:hypothetical protein